LPEIKDAAALSAKIVVSAARRLDSRLALTAAGRLLQSSEAQFDDALAAGFARVSAGFGANGRAMGAAA